MTHQEHPGNETWEILQQLDRYAETYDFPMLNNVDFKLAAINLAAFRGPSEWLLVFQEIAVFRLQRFVNAISAYGNRLSVPGTQLLKDDILEASAHGPALWDEEGNFGLNLFDFRARICGKEHHLTPSRQDYRAAGVDLDGDDGEPVKLLRLLVHELPRDLFAADEYLLRVCEKTDVELEKFLQLDGWQHPDIADDELPSEISCFQSLAEALSAGDSNLYECSPEIWNTHWSNWDDL